MRFATFVLISLLSFFRHASAAESKPVSLQEALDKGFIQVTTTGLGDHHGQCIEMAITSNMKKEIRVSIDAGLELFPGDTSVQSMIVSQEKIVTLAPHVLRKVKLFAFCIEQSDRGPGAEESFALGSMAEGNLFEVVKFLNQKKYQAYAAQHAVWCITDGAEIGGIYDAANPALAKELRMLVAKLTGKIPPWYQKEYKIEPGVQETFRPVKIHADFQYKLTEEAVVTFGIFNEQGDTIKTILANHLEKPGLHSMKITFESNHLPKGKYFARVTNQGKLIEEKVFEL